MHWKTDECWNCESSSIIYTVDIECSVYYGSLKKSFLLDNLKIKNSDDKHCIYMAICQVFEQSNFKSLILAGGCNRAYSIKMTTKWAIDPNPVCDSRLAVAPSSECHNKRSFAETKFDKLIQAIINNMN
jgi:hypothetical protein